MYKELRKRRIKIQRRKEKGVRERERERITLKLFNYHEHIFLFYILATFYHFITNVLQIIFHNLELSLKYTKGKRIYVNII